MQSKNKDNAEPTDSLQQFIESKLYKIVRDFSHFAKAINEEQNNINSSMNNTINTVNTLIDQLEENKSALLRAEDEIQNLKSEIQDLKLESERSASQIKTRSIDLASHYVPPQNSSSSVNDKDIAAIKDEISKLKQKQSKYDKMSHDINCMKYEVKKLKVPKVEIPNTVVQRSANNDEIMQEINELKAQINQVKKPKKKTKKSKFAFGKKKDKRISLSEDERVESKYFGSSSSDETETTGMREPEIAIVDKLNSQQIILDDLKSDVKTLKDNNVSPETVKKIKKQMKKLKKRTENLENKIVSKSSDGEDKKKANESPEDSETSVSNNKNVQSEGSSFESKTQENSD